MGEKTLKKANLDKKDPKGTDVHILRARITKRTNNALTLQWAKQKNSQREFGISSGSFVHFKAVLSV